MKSRSFARRIRLSSPLLSSHLVNDPPKTALLDLLQPPSPSITDYTPKKKKKKNSERVNLDVSPRLEIVVRSIIANSLELILGDPRRLFKQTMIWQILFSSSVVAEE
jgi:hypothetical protein